MICGLHGDTAKVQRQGQSAVEKNAFDRAIWEWGGRLSKASLFWRAVGGGENDDSNEISHTVYGDFLNRKKNLSRRKISSQIVKENLQQLLNLRCHFRFILGQGYWSLIQHSDSCLAK